MSAALAATRGGGHERNQRLHAPWQLFHSAKERPVIANVAIARELAAWWWSLAAIE